MYPKTTDPKGQIPDYKLQNGDARKPVKASIQMIDIKKDANMTRVYSTIQFIKRDENR